MHISLIIILVLVFVIIICQCRSVKAPKIQYGKLSNHDQPRRKITSDNVQSVLKETLKNDGL